jgi:hypothetical protein
MECPDEFITRETAPPMKSVATELSELLGYADERVLFAVCVAVLAIGSAISCFLIRSIRVHEKNA